MANFGSPLERMNKRGRGGFLRKPQLRPPSLAWHQAIFGMGNPISFPFRHPLTVSAGLESHSQGVVLRVLLVPSPNRD